MEWDGPAEMIVGNFDPAAIDESDRCPICGNPDGECIDWRPDTAEGYRVWVEAPTNGTCS